MIINREGERRGRGKGCDGDLHATLDTTFGRLYEWPFHSRIILTTANIVCNWRGLSWARKAESTCGLLAKVWFLFVVRTRFLNNTVVIMMYAAEMVQVLTSLCRGNAPPSSKLLPVIFERWYIIRYTAHKWGIIDCELNKFTFLVFMNNGLQKERSWVHPVQGLWGRSGQVIIHFLCCTTFLFAFWNLKLPASLFPLNLGSRTSGPWVQSQDLAVFHHSPLTPAFSNRHSFTFWAPVDFIQNRELGHFTQFPPFSE